MRIQHNIMAMNAYRNYGNNTTALSKNLEKLSSGYRINRAGDDAAGLAISEKMRAQIQGLNAAQKNVKDAISFVKTAEGAMQEIQDMLSRMKYLATQSANGTYEDDVDRAALQDEVDSLLEEINRIAQSANFNDIHMLNGGGDDSDDGDPDKTSMIAGNTPVAAAMKKDDANSKDSDTITVTATDLAALNLQWNTEKGTELGSATGDKTANDLNGLTVAVKYGAGKEYKITLSSESSDSGAADKVYVQDTDTLGTILKNIQDKLQAQMTADNTTGAQSGIAYTEFTDLTLTGSDDGSITGTVKVTQWIEDTEADNPGGPEGPDGPSGDGDKTEKPAVAQNTTVKVDLSGLDKTKNFKEDEVVQIGGKYFKFVKGSDEPVLAALTGDGSSGNPFTVEVGDTLEDSLAALAQTITDAKGTLGFSATYSNGELTIKAEKDFDKADDFKQATKIEFDTSSEVGAAMKKAWDNAVTKAIGDDDGAGTGTFSIDMQIGDSSNGYDTMTIKIKAMSTDSLGISDVSVATLSDAHDAIDTIKDAINEVSKVRGQLGAYQNRLEHTQNNLSVMTENIQDAESTIRDTDVAEEMMAYTKNNILIQSAQAMLAQANAVPQGVLQLLG